MEKILILQGIHKRFSGVYALKGCDFDLNAGEVHALVGETGAGKSTLMKVLTGIHKPDEGKIIYMGKEVSFAGPRDAQDMGISIVHQELILINNLTVAQNIFIGREGKGLWTNDKIINDKAKDILKQLNIDINPTDIMGDLTVGQGQLVEIVKAVSFDANIIIFDEPTASLSEEENKTLFKIINDLRDKGVGMVYISHRMGEIKEISDRVTVMRDGEYVGTKNTKDVTVDEIISMMVGRTIYEEPKSKSMVPPDAPVVLKVENLVSKDVKGVSFDLHKGEILDFAGLVGAGRTETARLIFGADPIIRGKIFINGLAGERFGIRNSGMLLVSEGVGDHGCEYMTGGRVVVLGRVGVNFAAGMTGGFAYVYDETGHFDLSCNVDSVDLESVLPGTDSEKELLDIISQHVQATGSEKGKRILENWNSERPKFVKIFPVDYRNALAKKA